MNPEAIKAALLAQKGTKPPSVPLSLGTSLHARKRAKWWLDAKAQKRVLKEAHQWSK